MVLTPAGGSSGPVVDVLEATVLDACERARRLILSADLRRNPSREKARADFQTELDLAVEKEVRQLLLAVYPHHSVTGEELPPTHLGNNLRWYIDPVDGTNNIIARRPDVAFSVALYDGTSPVIAAIDLPFRRLRFVVVPPRSPTMTGTEGTGGTEGIGTVHRPHRGRLLVGLPGDPRSEGERRAITETFAALCDAGYGVRITGALAFDLAAMAAGELAARVSFCPKAVDMAAGAALVNAYGGVVTDMAGRPSVPSDQPLLAAIDSHVYDEVRGVLVTAGVIDPLGSIHGRDRT